MLELGMIGVESVDREVYRSRRSTRVSNDWLVEVDLVSALSQSRQKFLYAIDIQEMVERARPIELNTL
jgi:hypothetical protein